MPQFQPRNTLRAQQLRNAATVPERTLWQHLGRRQVGGFKFSRQMPVGPYFCDFLCRSAGLIVELDGPSHDATIAKDAVRTRFLEEQGYKVIRFTNDDVMANAEGVVTAIATALAEIPTPAPSREREGRS